MLKIRRYYGHDCDSVHGFNNGYYIDDEFTEVSSIDRAFDACESVIKERYNLEGLSLREIDRGYELITGYYDTDGNELTEQQFTELDDDDEAFYNYVYVTFEILD